MGVLQGVMQYRENVGEIGLQVGDVVFVASCFLSRTGRA